MSSGDDAFERLLGQHVPGVDGYRFALIECGRGAAVRLQIVDATGDEVAWAAGVSLHELVRDARQKTAAHAARAL